jgi:hypothetical protein
VIPARRRPVHERRLPLPRRRRSRACTERPGVGRGAELDLPHRRELPRRMDARHAR